MYPERTSRLPLQIITALDKYVLCGKVSNVLPLALNCLVLDWLGIYGKFPAGDIMGPKLIHSWLIEPPILRWKPLSQGIV